MTDQLDLDDLPLDVIESLRSDVSFALQSLPNRDDWTWGVGVEHARVERFSVAGRPAFRVLVPLAGEPLDGSQDWAELRMLPDETRRRFHHEVIGVGPQPQESMESLPVMDLRVYAPGREESDDRQLTPQSWRPVLDEIVARLVAKDYDGLARDGIIFDYVAAGIADSNGRDIEEHPEDIVALPPGYWDDIELAFTILDEHWDDAPPLPRRAQVYLTLMTHGGPAELSAHMNVIDYGSHRDVEITSIYS